MRIDPEDFKSCPFCGDKMQYYGSFLECVSFRSSKWKSDHDFYINDNTPNRRGFSLKYGGYKLYAYESGEWRIYSEHGDYMPILEGTNADELFDLAFGDEQILKTIDILVLYT